MTTATVPTKQDVTDKKTRNKKGAGTTNCLTIAAKSHEKTGKEIEKARNQARAAEAHAEEREARLVKLVRSLFGGKFEGTARNHIAATEDDLAFLRTFGFNV